MHAGERRRPRLRPRCCCESLPEVAEPSAPRAPAGGVSIDVELPQLPPGHQLAWCRAYDAAKRRGVLVDLLTKREWASLLEGGGSAVLVPLGLAPCEA